MNTIKDSSKRIVWIDYLRCTGLLLVIASHVFSSSMPVLQMLFGCNVPIMVVVSGYCSYSSSDCSYFVYYKKRAKQLIIHSWLFFVFFFLLVGALNLGKTYPYSSIQIVKTFLFLDGIGYTWIIAIFILIAFVTPFIRGIVNKFNWIIWVWPVIYWILGLLLLFFQYDNILTKVFLYSSGYIFLSFVGFVIREKRERINAYIISCLVAIVCCIGVLLFTGRSPFDLSGNKYPPTVYYITYGLMITLIFMLAFSKMENFPNAGNLLISKCIVYISKVSFDVYLWHVLGLYITKPISNIWIRFVSVIVFSLSGAWLFNTIKSKLFSKEISL